MLLIDLEWSQLFLRALAVSRSNSTACLALLSMANKLVTLQVWWAGGHYRIISLLPLPGKKSHSIPPAIILTCKRVILFKMHLYAVTKSFSLHLSDPIQIIKKLCLQLINDMIDLYDDSYS